jgi:hypothetical protein
MLEVTVHLCKLVAVAFVLLLARNGHAQDVSLSGEASYTFRPSVSIDGVPDGAATVQTVQAAVAARFMLGPRTFLAPGISYQGQILRYNGAPIPSAPDELHALDTSLTVLHMFDERWSFLGRAAGGLSGDFVGLDRHLRWSSRAAAMRRLSPRFSAGLGALVSHGPGGWRGWPLALVDWQPTDHVVVESLLPTNAVVLYRPGDRWEVGVTVQLELTRWAVEKGDQDTTIDYRSVDAGALFAVRVTGDAWIKLFGGWNPYRRYNVDRGPGEGSYYPDHGFVFRSGLEIRPPGRSNLHW